MSAEKIIEIFIDDEGNISLETSGFSNDECLLETKELKNLLGEEKKRTMKNEFYNIKPKNKDHKKEVKKIKKWG